MIGLVDGLAHAHTAGIGVLDSHSAGLFSTELLEEVQRAVGVVDVVVGELLAVELLGGGQGVVAVADLPVEGGLLVGVLAVAHLLYLLKGQGQLVGKGSAPSWLRR